MRREIAPFVHDGRHFELLDSGRPQMIVPGRVTTLVDVYVDGRFLGAVYHFAGETDEDDRARAVGLYDAMKREGTLGGP